MHIYTLHLLIFFRLRKEDLNSLYVGGFFCKHFRLLNPLSANGHYNGHGNLTFL